MSFEFQNNPLKLCNALIVYKRITNKRYFLGRLYRAGTGYTVLPAILPAAEGIILRMLRALKKNLYKKPKKARKKKLSKRGFEPGHSYS